MRGSRSRGAHRDGEVNQDLCLQDANHLSSTSSGLQRSSRTIGGVCWAANLILYH
jgi:hypothetical protein